MRDIIISMLLVSLLIAGTSTQHIGTVTGVGCTKDSGLMKKEQRALRPFNKIAVDLPAEASITCTDRQSLTIEADEALMPQISSEVREGTLYLAIKGSICTESSIRMQIEIEGLSGLDAAATSEVMLSCDEIANHTKIAAQDAASLTIDATARDLRIDLQDTSEIRTSSIDAEALDITASGTASVTLQGRCESMHIDLEDATSFDGRALKAKAITIKTSGTAEATNMATDSLTATSHDASSITYLGRPHQSSIRTFDASEVIPEEE